MRTYDISSDLTVTVRGDGTVTWSSSYPMTLRQVIGEVSGKRDRYRRLAIEQDELLETLRLLRDRDKPVNFSIMG
jgi:hypothetical protein